MKRSVQALGMFILGFGCVGGLSGCVTLDSVYNGEPPQKTLILASKCGPVGQVLIDLNAGANVNEQDNVPGITPLMIAAYAGHKDIVRLLLNRGANVNIRSAHGYDALAMAILAGIPKKIPDHCVDRALPLVYPPNKVLTIVALLVQHGANVNETYPQLGVTPLIMAAKSGQSEVVKFLVTHGANIFETDRGGHTALQYAFATRQYETARALQSIADSMNPAPFLRRAKAEEARGLYAEALQNYRIALDKTRSRPHSSGDMFIQLRHIVLLFHKIKPTPAPSEKYREAMLIGLHDVKRARTPDDYKKAWAHFYLASRIAPWLREPYEAIGETCQNLKNYKCAIRAFQYYLAVAPNAPNARNIQDRIYILKDENNEGGTAP